MPLVKEYRIVLPCTVEEYQVGQLYSVAEASKKNTGGGDGIEVLKNEPYETEGERGQYTHKIYYLENKVPQFIRLLAPAGALIVHEKAWNAYPYCRTLVTNEYMKDDFVIKIETWHKPDLGEQENVHGLDPEDWKEVEVLPIDIADRNQVYGNDYKADEDPAIFKSVKTGRGPLGPSWKTELSRFSNVDKNSGETQRKEVSQYQDCPHMCAYKLVTVNFHWWGLQGRVEKFIHKQERRLFTNFHRQLICWIDKWVDLTMDDIRRMEEDTRKELLQIRQESTLRGMSAKDE